MIATTTELASAVSDACKAAASMFNVHRKDVWQPARGDKQARRARAWAIRHLVWQGVPKGLVGRAFGLSDEALRKNSLIQ
jgi:hypothetical protein